MSLQRDLVWKYLDCLYEASASYQLARYALKLNYDLLPSEVVHQAKRCLLDALGCAIGGYEAPGRPICENVVKEIGGAEEATIVGSGLRTSALNATLVNSFMLRFLDYNDMGGGAHGSDGIPAILAIAERQKTNGKDFLTSLVISYELGARFIESSMGVLSDRTWSGATRACVALPPALGKLMGLNVEQIANAIGSTASGNITLNILDANREEFVMRKNLRIGCIAYSAILNCLLAKEGFTGPIRVVEGDSGLNQFLANGNMDIEKLIDFSGWRILNTQFKTICCNATTQGHVMATLAIVTENDLKPEDIAKINLTASRREVQHTTNLGKKYPRNAESADHSAFYMNAIAIKDRNCGPGSMKPENFNDPVILDIIEKITIRGDSDMRHSHYEGSSEIITKDGRKFEKHIKVPHGLSSPSLTDKELEEKFFEMATKHFSDEHIKKIFNIVWNVDTLDNMGKLMKLLVFPIK